MSKSGLADSPFFAAPPRPIEPAVPPPEEVVAEKPDERVSETSTQPGKQASVQSSKHASMHAEVQESVVEQIRKAVKDVGKESVSFRFTPEEKKALLELNFTYKVHGHKTSENELTRIAVNFILEDHRQNGKNSVLAKVLDALKQ